MDTLITNARVRTFDSASPWAEAVGIQDGRIAYVGSGVDAPMAARRIDAGGRLLTPGIIDSHNHLLLGFDEDAVSLEGAADLGEVRRRIAEFAGRRGDLDWICAENAVYSDRRGASPQCRRPRRHHRQADLHHHLRPALGLAQPGGTGVAGHRRRHRYCRGAAPNGTR